MNIVLEYSEVPLQDGEKSLPFAYSASPEVTFASISYGRESQFVRIDDNSQYQIVPLEGSPRLGHWLNR